jgi:NAD-reducing hydrogenase small subunit
MSLLDVDERLLDIMQRAELVYSPLVDAKQFPEQVDIALVEGAIASEEDLAKIRTVRARTRLLVALGDCAVTANVPGMRNSFGLDAVLARAYNENVTLKAQIPLEVVPKLLPQALPVHTAVAVDLHVPGCPPSADTIFAVLDALIQGIMPDVGALTRFGA